MAHYSLSQRLTIADAAAVCACHVCTKTVGAVLSVCRTLLHLLAIAPQKYLDSCHWLSEVENDAMQADLQWLHLLRESCL